MTYTYKLARRIALLRDRALLSSLALAAACGSSDLTETDPGSPSSQAPQLVVIPNVVTIETNQTVSFAARESAGQDVVEAVEWVVSGGRISDDGAFTSSQPGTFRLVGRVQGEREQSSRAGTARVRVVPAQTKLASIRVAPENIRLAPGAEQAFEVSGYLPNQGIYGTLGVPVGVTWTASGGQVDASGLFTAGDEAGAFRVVATSVGTGLVDTVLGTIDPSLPPPVGSAPDPTPDSTPTPPTTLAGVALSPSTATLEVGAKQEFAMQGVLADGSSMPVLATYTATGGSITAGGLYTAGATAGTYQVIASVNGGMLADTATLIVTVAQPELPNTANSCLSQSGPLVTLAGGMTDRYDSRSKPLAAQARVDARRATWTAVNAYVINFSAGKGGCWSGGTVQGKWGPSTVWDVYHSTFALYAYGLNTRVEGFRVDNYGDAVRFNGTDNWSLRASWFTNIHDDCVENDMLAGGLIEDVLMDGCYVGISVRPGKAQLTSVNGSGKTVTIRNSLLRLKKFPLTAAAPNTSGGFIKAENRQPAKNVNLVYEGNVFRADALPGTGSLCLNQHNKVTHSTGNILVWLGSGNYPCTLPPGWTLTRDVKVWDNAVAAWKARHS